MFFSILTKNLNWEILTKNLITFKRWDEIKKNVNIMELTEKIQFLGGGGGCKKNNMQGELPKKESLDSLQI